MRIILDSSAVLALLLEEAGAAEVEAVLDGALISTVNLAEVVAALARDGNPEGEVRDIVRALALTALAPDEALAVEAGLLRRITDVAGLSLGDRFCLALARRLDAPVMTADRVWLKVSATVGVAVEAIR